MPLTQASFLLVLSAVCAAAAPLPTLTVRCYHYAAVPPSVVAKAQAIATDRLRAAGISVEWLDYPIVNGRPVGPDRPERYTELILDLLPEKMSQRIPGVQTQLGVSLMDKERQLAVHAYIFVERAEALAGFAALAPEIVLGTVMAHEIGHLLLGTNNHSGRGIMRGQWGVADLREAGDGGLNFTPDQMRRLRDGMVYRARAERKLQSGE